MVAIDSSQSAAPYHSLIPMQPSPCAETSRSPSRTRSMLIGDLLRAGAQPCRLLRGTRVVVPARRADYAGMVQKLRR